MVEDDVYAWMGRNASESERLDIQHRLLVKSVGYLLHPKIALPLNARIADVATGTGAVLRDMAQTMPRTYHFDGFDISDAQYPSDLPDNVKFHVADAKKPFPAQFHGQFDAVNIRYLNAGMQAEDWEIVTRNVSALLKTKGWLQWIEGDFSQVAMWPVLDPSKPTSGALQEMTDLLGTELDGFAYFKQVLPEAFRKASLENVRREVTSSDRLPEMRLPWANITGGPLTNLLMHRQQTKKVQVSREHCEKLLMTMFEEVASGAYYCRHDLYTILGQKV